MLITVISMSKIKAQDSLVKHSVHVAPFVGYNATFEAPVYGAEVGYEYRLNKSWGFTAGINIAYTQKNANGLNTMISNGSSQFRNMKFLQNSIYAGAKYYVGRFYLSADLGYRMPIQHPTSLTRVKDQVIIMAHTLQMAFIRPMA